MYRLLIKETKNGGRSVADFMDMLGTFFVNNHKWKMNSEPASVTGKELTELISRGLANASFSAMEGDEVLFKIDFNNEWTVYTMKRQWVEFLEEKCVVLGKEELPDEGFGEFMLD